MKVLRSTFVALAVLGALAACSPTPTQPTCPATLRGDSADVIINGIVVGRVPLRCVDGAY